MLRDHKCSKTVWAGLTILLLGPSLRAQTSQPASRPAASQPASLRRWFDQETFTGDWLGLGGPLEELGISFDVTYQQQFQQNLRGGLDTHNAHRFSGTLDYALELDFEKMGLIPGGSFFIKARSSYSEGINDGKVGAIYDVNGDAFRNQPAFVRKWWYKQTFLDEKVELRLGRLQAHKDLFDVSLYANHEDKDFMNNLLNRSGIMPQSNGMGAFIRVKPVDWVYIQAAAIDAQAKNRTRTGFDTGFHDEAWFNGFWEVGFTPKWATDRGPMPGRYRIGWWYDAKAREVYRQTYDGRLPQEFRGGNLGLYLGFDQMIWKERSDPKDTQGLGFFSRYGVAHRDVIQVAHTWQLGASYKGLLPERDDDVLGFSFGQGILSPRYREYVDEDADRESVWELYYRIQVAPWCQISPDLQIIQNPGGDKSARDAIVGGIRLCMTL